MSSLRLRVNSLGDKTCAPGYRDRLSGYLESHTDELCDEHRYKWAVNPLRIFDCKRPECRKVSNGAPKMRDELCEGCRRHFADVLGGLDRLAIGYERDDYLVRGLDYYTRTTFEYGSDVLEGVGGGGRYDGLVAALGGPDVSGVGFGAGIERILLACDAEGVLSAGDLRLSRAPRCVRRRRDRRGDRARAHPRVAGCRPGRRPGVRRAFHEGAAEGSRPFGRESGLHSGC